MKRLGGGSTGRSIFNFVYDINKVCTFTLSARECLIQEIQCLRIIPHDAPEKGDISAGPVDTKNEASQVQIT